MSQVDKAHVCADECCAPAPLVLPIKSDRAALVREAFRLEWLTIAWMTIEAVVAIAAAITAGSMVLMAFGLDSVIELASAGVLIWRLSIELRHGQQFSERAERTASRIGGALLFALAAYVTGAAIWNLWIQSGQEYSWPGFVVALVAIPAMRYLAHRKIVIAEKIGSRALRADAMEAVTCGWLSFVVVVSLAAQWALGAWWIDSIASLAVVWLLVKEGREAWAGEELWLPLRGVPTPLRQGVDCMDARPFHVRGANEKRLWAYSGPSAPEPAAAPLPEGLRPGNGAMSTRKSRRPIRAKRRRATDT